MNRSCFCASQLKKVHFFQKPNYYSLRILNMKVQPPCNNLHGGYFFFVMKVTWLLIKDSLCLRSPSMELIIRQTEIRTGAQAQPQRSHLSNSIFFNTFQNNCITDFSNHIFGYNGC